MKIGVRVMPRNEVLDSQGRAVEKTLQQHGREVSSCKVGRYVVLEFDGMESEEAVRKAEEIASFVLHNPLIETFEVEEIQ